MGGHRGRQQLAPCVCRKPELELNPVELSDLCVPESQLRSTPGPWWLFPVSQSLRMSPLQPSASSRGCPASLQSQHGQVTSVPCWPPATGTQSTFTHNLSLSPASDSREDRQEQGAKVAGFCRPCVRGLVAHYCSSRPDRGETLSYQKKT